VGNSTNRIEGNINLKDLDFALPYYHDSPLAECAVVVLLKYLGGKWEEHHVALRLVCIEVHGLLEKTHSSLTIFRNTVKATGDPCQTKLVSTEVILWILIPQLG